MKPCPHCGLHHTGVCGSSLQRPQADISTAYGEIEQKIRRARFTSVGSRWANWGAVSGAVVAILLLVVAMLSGLLAPQSGSAFGSAAGDLFVLFMVNSIVAVLFGALLGAGVGLLAFALARPVFIALFCSIDRFEQEYEATSRRKGESATLPHHSERK